MAEFDPILFRAVYDALFGLSVPAHMDGFGYLVTAITLAVEDPRYIRGITKYLYPEVARENGSTPQRVERSIRTAIEAACARCRLGAFDDYFGGAINPETGKPTNAMFIATVAEKIRLEIITSGAGKA